MPQQLPGIGADVSSLMPQVGADVSHLMGGGPAPASAPSGGGLDAAKRFVMGFAHNVDPRPALKLVYDVGTGLGSMFSGNPHDSDALIADVKGLAASQVEQFQKGYAAYKAGRYSEAAGHTLAGALPLVGPAAANTGEQIGSGDIAGGLGATTGLLAPMAAAKVLPKSLKIPAVARNLNPEEVAAVELGQAHGVPIDAGTATGNRFVKGAQALADASPLGSRVAEGAKAAQARGLATMGEQLASKANRSPVTAEQAGDAARAGVEGQVHEWHGEASKAYEKLRTLEADPKHATVIQPEVGSPAADAPYSFTAKAKPTSNEVFLAALDDARKQGYTGSAAELKAKFDDRITQARGLKAATAEGDEYSHAALLKEIRSRGGLRPTDPDFIQGAPTRQMRGEHQSAQQANRQYYGKNAVYRTDGLAVDDMLQQLSEDPKWGAVITSDTDLIDVVHRGGLKPPAAAPGNVEHHLRGVGVEPGVQWWNENAPAQTVHMAVDLREAKAALQPTYESLKREAELVPLMGDKARALTSLDRLLTGPDHAPLSVVDAALGELKTFARADNPDLRSIGQGKAVAAITQLHQAVQRAAEAAGPEAVQALSEGRQATTAKYIAADVLKGLAEEPVKTFGKLTARADTNVQQLRKVSAQTPEAMPQIGRAILDGMLDKATAEGGFSHAPKLLADWQRLGPETKSLLYRDSAYIKDLDRFFLLAKKLSETPNPSGTALVANSGAQLGLVFSHPAVGVPIVIGSGALSKMLHSKVGVQLLTQGLTLPARSLPAMANYGTRLSAWLKSAEAIGQPAMADENRAPTPGTTVQR